MEEGENPSLHSRSHGRVPVRTNDEQNRLVFKTQTWLKILYMHGFLNLSQFYGRFFDTSLTLSTLGKPILPHANANSLSFCLCHPLIVDEGGKNRLRTSLV